MYTIALPPDASAPWPEHPADAGGFDRAKLAEAVAYAAEHETPWSRDLTSVIEKQYFEPPPWNEILGPVRPRGGPNGLITRHGKLVARWGDTRQVDLTFSIAKSYLSILAGVAHDRGLLPNVHERVGLRVQDGGFEPPHNDKIAWEHFLHQTSEWEGTLWEKPDLVDRNRVLSIEGTAAAAKKKGTHRDLTPPGGFWEYNDVRVNRFSLALMRLFHRPLPEVFAETIMAPIGASESWEWWGYRNSTIEVDGRLMTSVPGGSHWGGGVAIHAEDQARIGLLMLGRGDWGGRRLLSEEWIAASTRPAALNPQYGYLWWLNTDRGRYKSASPESFFAIGAGGNTTWIDPATGIVAAMRWMDPAATDGFIARVMAALSA